MTRLAVGLVAATALVLAVRGPVAAPVPEVVAIEGATVWRAPGDKLEGATIVLRDGKVAALGKDVKAPADARRIDGRGLVVTAGLVDAYTTVGLVEIDLEESFNDGALRADDDQVHAAFRAVDAYNAQSVAIPVARAGGVTSVLAAPSGGLVSGASAWMALADATRPGDVTVLAPAAMHMALGNRARGAAQNSRGMAVERARELFADAREYGKRKGAYEKNQTRRFAASRLDLEALAPVLAGRLPLVVRADRASDIEAALALQKEHKLRLVIAGGAEAWQLADALAAAKVPVILNPTQNLPESFEQLHVRDDGAAILARAGVTVVISTLGEQSNVRTLRQIAGIAVAWGLTWDQALAAVTTAPASIFGKSAEGRGTLAVGAVADVVVWTGDPFELSTRPAHVFVRGVEQSLRTRQTLLLERYR
jgi:imidazolonepropionase-like amidohydrolase